jgi:hypothetical protein
VMVLRTFRDNHLLTNAFGMKLVRMYYTYSPPIADYIADHDAIRLGVRIMLTPLVYMIKYPFMAVIILLAGLVFMRRHIQRTFQAIVSSERGRE